MEISHVLETDIHSFQLEQCDGWVLEIVGRGIWAGQTSPSVSQFLHLANCLRRKNNRCRADLATSLPSTPSLVLHTVTSTYSSHHLPPSLPCPLLLNTSCLPSRQAEGTEGIGSWHWKDWMGSDYHCHQYKFQPRKKGRKEEAISFVRQHQPVSIYPSPSEHQKC